ncbi:hypothetical protein [Geothrix sp.]|jgi:hypothetical protein|uniref:hypothetical protein n=1 Tax=Geothrix sp. TaxID=1962974 RepID=UPI0025C19A51|nr:hypothetical protein [Geothrix sp.]
MGGGFKGFFQRLSRFGSSRHKRRIHYIKAEMVALRRQVAATLELAGGTEARRVAALPPRTPLSETEFKVYSQFGDDGIIQYLIAHLPVIPTFVEFGVEDYTEANTRFLLAHSQWRGLILDGRPDLDAVVAAQGLPMLYDLQVRSAFITAENINDLILGAGFSGEIGLLSVDIDGNDYWVWKAITCIQPQIVVAEYNAVFGPDRAVTVPYSPAFDRRQAHHSYLYFGASLRALCQLAEEKGYAFVGCNEAGNNAYFVRKDLSDPFLVVSPEAGFMDSRFRESRDTQGHMNRLAGPARLEAIAHLPVVDLESGQTLPLRDLRSR